MNPLSRFPFGNRWTSTTASVLGMALLFVAIGMAVATLVAVVDGADALALATATGGTALLGAV